MSSSAHSDDLRSRVVVEVAGGASRRAAAAWFRVSPSSAIRWVQQHDETGSVSARPRGGKSRSPLEPHAAWLLALIAETPDLTLREIVDRVLETHALKISETSLRRFFQRHAISFKKKPARRRTGSARRGGGTAELAGRPGQA